MHHACDLTALARHCHHTGESIPAVLMVCLNPPRAQLLALPEMTHGALLSSVIDRLANWLSDRGHLFRVGMGDFVLTLADPRHIERLQLACESLQRAFEAPLLLGDQPIRIGVSIGAAHCRGQSVTSEQDLTTLLKQAAVAMQQARQGNHRYTLYDPDMDQQAARYWQIVQQMQSALDLDHFRMVYQPYYNLATHACEGIEALIRLRLPDLGDISPDEFIPICEQNNLIIPLSDWIFKRCAHDLKPWLASSPGHSMSLNVSALSLSDPEFVEVLGRAMSTWGISPDQLIIELTETMPMGDLTVVLDTLLALRKQGIRIALDDFGTGHASLANLMQLPVDQVKLDRMFVSQITQSDAARTLVRTLITLARDLGLVVVAEGVEDEQTADLLREAGCHYLQGYVITSPLEASQLATWLHLS